MLLTNVNTVQYGGVCNGIRKATPLRCSGAPTPISKPVAYAGGLSDTLNLLPLTGYGIVVGFQPKKGLGK